MKDNSHKSASALNFCIPNNSKWVQIGKAYRRNGKIFIPCRCLCGLEKDVYSCNLANGQSNQCMSCASRKKRLRHGMRSSRIYKIWQDMKFRCDNSGCKSFVNYGGRGISYHKDFKKFIPFFNYVSKLGYLDELTIDRINNDGDYTYGNIKWSSAKEQANNRRPYPKRKKKLLFSS